MGGFIAKRKKCGRADTCEKGRKCLLRMDGFGCVALGDLPCACAPEKDEPHRNSGHCQREEEAAE